MIAVILVGGFGTRLRPLTCTRPKQLLPLGDSTLIEYMIRRLVEQGFREVVLAVGYSPDKLQKVLSDGAGLGVDIHFSLEHEPLGTAGPIKQAEAYLRGSGEFFVLNGDIVSDMDYLHLLDQHRRHQATASIALYRVDDPSRYGVVDITLEGQIRAFIEKPSAGAAPSNLINAGCYVLDESVLDQIPSGRKVSIERETFPLLCRDNRVYGWEHKGLWIDTGTAASYLEANRAVLATSSKQSREVLAPSASLGADTRLINPVLVGAHTKIGDNSAIGPNVTIGRNVTIGANTSISDTVIFNDAIIHDSVVLENTVIGQNALIGANNHLKGLVLVGDHAIIDAGTNIPTGARICPNRHVRKGAKPVPVFF